MNQLIGFISPQFDPEENDLDVGLPTRENEGILFKYIILYIHIFLINVNIFLLYSEFRPFARRLPEFKFWYSCIKAVGTAFLMTYFEVFNIPVFWPILLLYFIVLFFITMKRQIRHMIKHKYVPWSWGKAKYRSVNAKGVALG